MSYTPALPVSGYAGWIFLKRTMPQQTKAFQNQVSVRRDETYFREKIGSVTSARQLVSDPRLLRVALGAFGLEDDLANKFFLQKVLDDGTLRADALSNRLADKRYRDFSAAFGFGDFSVPRTKLSEFADEIISRFHQKGFQRIVGSQDDSMRLALNVESELPLLARGSASELSKWYTILGTPPLRQIFQVAFGLPASFAAIDIDKQVETFQSRTRAIFGDSSVDQFRNPDRIEKLVRTYLVRSELATGGQETTRGQVALTLLQQARPPRF